MAYTEQAARIAVVEAGHKLLECGLTARTWGNISARISDEEFIITPSGKGYEEMTPEDLVKVKMEDCSYEGENKPSSEKKIHAACYLLRPNVDFIIHTHQFYATAVSVRGKDIEKPFIPCAAYGLPSTGKLKDNILAKLVENQDSDSVLMESHGAICLGESMNDAFTKADELEKACREVYFKRLEKTLARTLSYKPENDIISAVEGKEIKLVSSLGETMYPAIDDLVQIAGTSIRCVPENSSDAKISRALKGRNAVLVRGKGSIVTGEDKEAIRMILRKGCAAALYMGSVKKGLGFFDAKLQRFIYTRKYSKKK